MELNNTIMNTKEQWFVFYKSLRDILRDGDSKYTGMEAFNEINTLLILIFLEDKLDNFNIQNAKMCKFKYIYYLFFTKVEKEIKDKKMKEPELSQFMKIKKYELFRYLFDKRRNYEIQDKTENTISFKLKDEVPDDIYFNHHPSVFSQILRTSKLNRLFIRTKMNDNDSTIVDISTITGFIEDHCNDVYLLIKKIAETFYIKDKDGNLESILQNSDLNFDALGGAYEKFMTDDTMNSKNTGEFFTRRDLIRFIIEELDINENDIIYDSSVGTGGFLLESIRVVKDKLLKESNFQEKMDNFLRNNIHGNEIKPNLYKSLMLNILMNDPKGLCLNNLLCIDSMLIDDDDIGNHKKALNFSTISTGNPPYGCSLEKTPSNIKIRLEDNEEIYCDDEDTKENYFGPIMSGKNIIKNSSGQFIMHLIRCLRNNGKAGFIIDRGILINGTDTKKSWNKSLRKFMIEKNKLTKIVLLPTGIFEHTNFATCVIFLEKGGKTSSVQFQELYFKDEDKGVGTKPFYVGNSWNVSFQQLKEKDYSLNPKDFEIPLMEYQKNKNDEVVEMKSDTVIPVENKKVGDICNITRGKSKLLKEINGQYNIIGGGKNFIGKYNSYLVNENLPILSISGANAGMVQKFNQKIMMSSDAFSVFSKDENKLLNPYLFYFLKINENKYKNMQHGNGQPHFYPKDLEKIIIPVPSISNQQKIIDKLDIYFGEESVYNFDLTIIMKYESANRLLNYIFNEEWSKLLDCIEKAQRIDDLKSIWTNQLITELSNRTILKFNPETKSKTKTNLESFIIETFLKKEFDLISKDMIFENKKIGDVCTFPKLIKRTQKDHNLHGKYPLYGSSIIDTYFMDTYDIENEGIILNKTNGQGKYKVSYNKKYSVTDAAITFLSNSINLNIKYIYYILNTGLVYECYIGNGRKNLGMDRLKNLEIPIPSISDQQKIVNYLDEKMEYHKKYWDSMSEMFSNEITSEDIEENNLEDI